MKSNTRNWIASIAVYLGFVVVIFSLPAFGQSQTDLEQSVLTALEKAPLVERVESITVYNSNLNKKGQGIFPKKDSDGNQMVDSSGKLIFDVITDAGVVTSTEQPLKMVEVVFIAASSFTTKMTQRGIERAMMDGYQAIFTHGVPVLRGALEAKMLTIDSYGIESLTLVYGTTLRTEVAVRMNWKNRHIVDPSKVWDTYFINNAFRK